MVKKDIDQRDMVAVVVVVVDTGGWEGGAAAAFLTFTLPPHAPAMI